MSRWRRVVRMMLRNKLNVINMSSEFPQNKDNLDLSKVDTHVITEKIDKYNEQFGMGKSMARVFMAAMEDEEGGGNAMNEQAAEEAITFEDLKGEIGDFLDNTGLELEPVKAGWIMASSEGSQSGTEMKLNLKDGKKFVAYLESLDKESITESQTTGLKDVAKILTEQFSERYQIDNVEDDRLMELMGNLSNIIDQYKRLEKDGSKDLHDSISTLEKYFSFARQGCLKEFMAAEKLCLDKPFDNKKFTLQWHKDANAEYLREKWDLVLSTLHSISQNKSAESIYVQAIETAREAIESALKDMEVWKSTGDDWKVEHANQYIPILTSAKAQLKDF